MSGLTLADPIWLFLLLLPLALWLLPRFRARDPESMAAADLAPMMPERMSLRLRLRQLPLRAQQAALLLAILAMARPQLGERREIVSGEGIDIVLALDVSGSMAALDFQPEDRLGAAKAVLGEFIERRPYDRMGLVVFAREAFKHSPVTVDHGVLERQLAQIELAEAMRLEDGTALGLGLATAAEMLRQAPEDGRAVVLLTDGVSNAGEIDPITAAEAAAALGVRVYTVGMGKQGQVPFPMPGVFGPRIMYQESELDEETLQNIASITGGRFYRAVDSAGLLEIYRQIDALERSDYEMRRFDQNRELAGWLLTPALICLALGLALGQTWLRSFP